MRDLSIHSLSNGDQDFIRAPEVDSIVQVDDHTIVRALTIKPSMCGYNAQLVGLIGDLTWETVGLLCGINSFKAFDPNGIPTYLSFYYYQILGDLDFHLHGLTFGDQLRVVSTCYGLGSESIVTLHRLCFKPQNLPDRVTMEEMIHNRYPACLYVQNFNRWVQRGDGGNENLSSASPQGFNYQHLPGIAAELSPRIVCDLARRTEKFTDPQGYVQRDELTVAYSIDMARDINGVGLLYFASYFAMTQRALVTLWQKQGRSPQSFFNRRVMNQRILFVGNADPGTRLSLKISHWLHENCPGKERFDVNIMEEERGRLLAIVAVYSEE